MSTDTSPEWQRGTTTTRQTPIPVADPAQHLALALTNFAQATNGGPAIGELAFGDTTIPLTYAGVLLLTGQINKTTRVAVNTHVETGRRPLPYPPLVDGMTAGPRTRH